MRSIFLRVTTLSPIPPPLENDQSLEGELYKAILTCFFSEFVVNLYQSKMILPNKKNVCPYVLSVCPIKYVLCHMKSIKF